MEGQESCLCSINAHSTSTIFWHCLKWHPFDTNEILQKYIHFDGMFPLAIYITPSYGICCYLNAENWTNNMRTLTSLSRSWSLKTLEQWFNPTTPIPCKCLPTKTWSWHWTDSSYRIRVCHQSFLSSRKAKLQSNSKQSPSTFKIFSNNLQTTLSISILSQGACCVQKGDKEFASTSQTHFNSI